MEEAKAKLEQLQMVAEGAESEFSSVRDTADQMLEDMEPLKVTAPWRRRRLVWIVSFCVFGKEEQLRLEAECAKFERVHAVLENKLKAHEDNVHAMKTEVCNREEELQVSTPASVEVAAPAAVLTLQSCDRRNTCRKPRRSARSGRAGPAAPRASTRKSPA